MDNEENKDEIMEDVTKYGEFVSSYFAWITPKRQKHRAEELQEITKKEEKKQKK